MRPDSLCHISAFTLFALVLAIAISGCGQEPESPAVPVPDASESPSERPADEAWVQRPFAEWPQIVLTNQAEFANARELIGASAFLVQNHEGHVIACTARHLLGAAGGVDPAVIPDELDEQLVSWALYPRTRADDRVTIRNLILKGLDWGAVDWLALEVDDSPNLPAKPLRLGANSVAVGDTVFMIGCSYQEPDCSQRVYKGTVTEREYEDRFRFDIDPPVDLRGFSGAPIVNESGLLVGVVTVWFSPKMDGDLYLEGGGEDVETIASQIRAYVPGK